MEGRESWPGSVRGTGAVREGGCPDQPATVLWQVDPGRIQPSLWLSFFLPILSFPLHLVDCQDRAVLRLVVFKV